MPVLTSLYLCNSTVYAAVGSPTANGAKITAACQTELPEGCLINGIITNEAELTAALQGFFAANELPTQRVALAVGGSQFNHRVLTLPRMSEKKRAAVLTREFSTGGADVTAPLDDYMLLSTDKKTKADTVLATRVESAVIETYINLAAACGLKLYSMDLALAGQVFPIPADEVVEAMRRVGRQLPPELRETAQGGIADTETGRAIAARLAQE